MTKLTLYGYYRSSCSARLRIALDLKEIPYEPVYVNIKDGDHLKESYGSINPSHSVPTLIIEEDSNSKWHIAQSLAALDYLDESNPKSSPLLPTDAKSRAEVRTLALIMAGDVQPTTNMKVLKRAASYGADAPEWARTFMEKGFKAYEAIAKSTAGKYSHGDEITVADICLVPAIWNAERYGLSLDAFPTIRKVYAALSEHPSFHKSHWQRQPDCPEELR